MELDFITPNMEKLIKPITNRVANASACICHSIYKGFKESKNSNRKQSSLLTTVLYPNENLMFKESCKVIDRSLRIEIGLEEFKICFKHGDGEIVISISNNNKSSIDAFKEELEKLCPINGFEKELDQLNLEGL